MRLETQKYLFDILEAVNLITEFCAEESYENYNVSAYLRSAVERHLSLRVKPSRSSQRLMHSRSSAYLTAVKSSRSEINSCMAIKPLMTWSYGVW